jgi:hypothetical protein
VRYLDRLRRYLQKGPEAIAEPWTVVPAEAFAVLISECFHPAIAEQGFERCHPTRWVRSRLPDVRDVVEIVALKGASYSAVWGISLDFVPTIRNGKSWSWHRTAKSARPDLVFDPYDYVVHASAWSVTRFESAGELPAAIREWTSRVLGAASDFFRPLQNLLDVEAAFVEKENRKFVRFGPQNYPQHYLAHAFVLARLSRLAEAAQMFARSLDLFPLEPQLEARARKAMGFRDGIPLRGLTPGCRAAGVEGVANLDQSPDPSRP